MDDRDADFTAYVDGRWASLVKSAVLMGCSVAEAEDVVQSALLRCYQAWPRVQRASSRDGYVYRVLVNVLAKSRRRRWHGELPTARVPEPAGRRDDLVAEAVSTRGVVRDALARLPEEQRVAVVLRYFADISERDVAEILGVPPGTVKSRVSRGLAQLAVLIDAAGEESPEVTTGSANGEEAS